MHEIGWDIISDLHGDMDRLVSLLAGLDRNEKTGSHPTGRKLLFLGDFIDRGYRNHDVLAAVFNMINKGAAVGLMGNHELNAILYATPGYPGPGSPLGWMRRHSASNNAQHAAFLDEFPFGSQEHAAAIKLMLRLPLFFETEGFRAAHACWNDDAIRIIRARRPDGRILPVDLQEIADEETDFAKAVVMTCKGPEISLPKGVHFYDGHGEKRTRSRMAWWNTTARTWRDIVASVDDPSTIPDDPLPDHVAAQAYPRDVKPVFFGHYQLREQMIPDGNVLCLDVPALPQAYRWNGEARLSPSSLVGEKSCGITMEPA